MTVYVALLRGVNVGGRGKLEMGTLKKAFEELGCADVRTYINSGNVVFRDRRAASTVGRLAEEAVGFRVAVRSLAQMRELVRSIPDVWATDSEQKTDVAFLLESDEEVVWHALRKDLKPREGIQVAAPATVRNVNTVRKLTEMMEEL